MVLEVVVFAVKRVVQRWSAGIRWIWSNRQRSNISETRRTTSLVYVSQITTTHWHILSRSRPHWTASRDILRYRTSTR